MPVLEWRPDPSGYEDEPFGSCDDCGVGNNGPGFYVPLRSRDSDGDSPWFCASCMAQWEDGDEPGMYDDEFDGSSEPSEHVETYDLANDVPLPEPAPPSPMTLPALVERTPRMLSFEQEIGRGGREVSSRLFDAGFATSPSIQGYHSGQQSGLCYVEQDASVDAEIIYGRLKLDRNQVAAEFEGALNVVRKAIAEDAAKLDMRCGLHIHVDVGSANLEPGQRYGMDDLESLYHLWNGLEDTIYRLGAANWSKHRTLVAHTNYAPATPKSLVRRADFGTRFEGDRHALNLSNYLACRGYCRCGAFAFADWQGCTCDLPKATIEFRVFNGTANLRKMNAYAALCLALVEYAQRNRVTAGTLSEYGWTATEGVLDPGKASDRLRFILEELPLTHSEMLNLRYCAECSSLSEVVEALPIKRRRPRRVEDREVVTA